MQIRQPAGDEEPMRVLGQTLVADLRKLEQLLDGEKRMLDCRTDFRLGAVLLLLPVGERGIAPSLLVGEVLRPGCRRVDRLTLPSVSQTTVVFQIPLSPSSPNYCFSHTSHQS